MGQRFSRRPRPSKRHEENKDITRSSGRRRAQRHEDTEDVARQSATIQTDRLTESTKPSGGKNEDGPSEDDTASNLGEGATGMSVNTHRVYPNVRGT